MNTSGLEAIGIFSICEECAAMYSGMPGQDHLLPCGHKASRSIFTADSVRRAYEAQDMINWLMYNNLLHPEAQELVEDVGGYLYDGLNLKVPPHILTIPDRGAIQCLCRRGPKMEDYTAKEETDMDINELTIGEAKELLEQLNGLSPHHTSTVAVTAPTSGLDSFAHGEIVIIRTYSAGVWCGKLCRKAGKEVILTDARRMWQWRCEKSISLSGVAVYGIDQSRSKIAPPVPEVWLEAIEIIPLGEAAARSIMEAPIVQAE